MATWNHMLGGLVRDLIGALQNRDIARRDYMEDDLREMEWLHRCVEVAVLIKGACIICFTEVVQGSLLQA